MEKPNSRHGATESTNGRKSKQQRNNNRLTKSADVIRPPAAASPKNTSSSSFLQSSPSREQSGSSSSLNLSRSASPKSTSSDEISKSKYSSSEEVKQDRLEHTLYFSCGFLTKQELITAFNEVILPDVWKVLGEKRNVQLLINKVRSTKETGFKGDLGYAFARISDTEVVNVLCKLNPDGSPREEKREKPRPAQTISAPSVIITAADVKVTPPQKKPWYEDDEEMFPEEPLPEYEIIKLEPLVKPYFIKYTSPEVLAFLKELGEDKDGVTLDFQAALGKRARYGCANHVLYFNGDVPETITERDIRPIFAPFAHDSTTKSEYHFSRERISAALPIVRFISGKDREGKPQRKMLIHFDSNSHDAQDARVMNLHFNVRGYDLAVDFAPRSEIYRESIDFERNQHHNNRSPNNHRNNKPQKQKSKITKN